MISALARAAQAFDEPNYRMAAERAAHLLLADRWKNGKLTRTATVPAMVEDYAFPAMASSISMKRISIRSGLLKATEFEDTMLAQFHDPKDGGLFQTDGRDAGVIVRAKEDYDGAEPSGNSMAALLLLRLAQFTDRARYRDAGKRRCSFSAVISTKHRVPFRRCCACWIST